jgi:hypothetical protein
MQRVSARFRQSAAEPSFGSGFHILRFGERYRDPEIFMQGKEFIHLSLPDDYFKRIGY